MWYEISNRRKDMEDNMSNFEVSTVPADSTCRHSDNQFWFSYILAITWGVKYEMKTSNLSS